MKIDLRSDFTARPTKAMVEAMVRAAEMPSGFGLREDPTVVRLEALAAEILGKEEAHVVTSESAAASVLSGAMPR
jgi:threonine aldolase